MAGKQINSLIPIILALGLVVLSVVIVLAYIDNEVEDYENANPVGVTDKEYINSTVFPVMLTVRVTARDEGRAEGVIIVKDGCIVGTTGTDGNLILIVTNNQTYRIGAIFPDGYEYNGRNYNYENVVVGTTDRAVFFTMAAVE